MSKFKVGDVVVWKENLTNFSAKKGDYAVVKQVDGNMLWVSWHTKRGQVDGWYGIEKFESIKEPFNPLKDPWYILTPTKEAFDDAIAWAKGEGLSKFLYLNYSEDTTYVRNDIIYGVVNGIDDNIKAGSCEDHKQIILTKSISYEYNIVEEETEEQKEAKKKAEEINAVRIEMQALAKRLKDLEG